MNRRKFFQATAAAVVGAYCDPAPVKLLSTVRDFNDLMKRVYPIDALEKAGAYSSPLLGLLRKGDL